MTVSQVKLGALVCHLSLMSGNLWNGILVVFKTFLLLTAISVALQ